MKRFRRVLAIILMLVVSFAPTALAGYSMGDHGAGISRAKKALKSAGYYSGSVNNRFDKALKSGVLVFQKANALDETGDLDDVTLMRLETGNFITYKQYENKLRDQALRPGGKGKYVEALYKRLIALKYLSGKAGSTYNAKVQEAVKLFQSYNGLSQTGIADLNTRTLMNSKKAVSKKAYEDALTKPLKSGSKGEAVKTVQTQLKGLGYYEGKISGVYDKALSKAVSKFQTANGIKATGTACKKTRTLLNSGKGLDKKSYEESLKTKPLKPNTSGEAVKVLQNRLKELGYFTASVTGKYASTTKSAVMKFQKYNGLKETGTADVETRRVMNLSTAKKVSDVEGPKTIKKGSTGDGVKAAQKRLKELGFFKGSVNGKYLSDTVSAAKDFQEANELKKTGILTGADQILLLSEKAISKTAYQQRQKLGRADKIVATATALIDRPYLRNAAGPNSFDCSGFIQYVYKKEGITVKRTAKEQAYTKGQRIEKLSDVQKGDILVFADSAQNPKDVTDHVAIYIGNGQIVHASQTAGKVLISKINNGYYNKAFSWAVRLI